MRTRLTCVVAPFDLAPLELQGAPPWDGVPGVETPGLEFGRFQDFVRA